MNEQPESQSGDDKAQRTDQRQIFSGVHRRRLS
jgi:hypothetical protein